MEELELTLHLLDQTKNGDIFIQEEEKTDKILLKEINMLF